MYRVIFEHHVKPEKIEAFISEWKNSSDIIQKEPGALGSKMFRLANNPDNSEPVFFAMADWVSKAARTAAISAIKARDINIESHNAYVLKTLRTEYELVGESLAPTG